MVLREINQTITSKKLFVNVSKGIEPETSYRVSQIVEEEIKNNLRGYVALSGPSHAEEVILRKLTALTAASTDLNLAIEVQNIFSNDKYLRVYSSDDVIGVETGGAMKNAIAIVSGVASGMGLGENARALLISRGITEIVAIVQALGGNLETAYGLSGVGDLIVTASSMNSRNFQCGLKIGQGMSVEEAVGSSAQTVEGVRAIEAGYEIGKKYNLDLPIIDVAYEVVHGKVGAKEALQFLLSRDLKTEKYW
jgi:glycerol-3-phosphate dehydrogenase (NAD(P)+)